jgi:hypothetical protein
MSVRPEIGHFWIELSAVGQTAVFHVLYTRRRREPMVIAIGRIQKRRFMDKPKLLYILKGFLIYATYLFANSILFKYKPLKRHIKILWSIWSFKRNDDSSAVAFNLGKDKNVN